MNVERSSPVERIKGLLRPGVFAFWRLRQRIIESALALMGGGATAALAHALANRPLTPELVIINHLHGFVGTGYRGGRVRWLLRGPNRIILPVQGTRISSRLRRDIQRWGFTVSFNTCFEDVIRACAVGHRTPRWISDELIAVHTELHRRGFGHTVEMWRDNSLVGGIWGISYGGTFELMSTFHREPDAGTAALTALVDRASERGFVTINLGFGNTPQFERFGAVRISREELVQRNVDHLRISPRFGDEETVGSGPGHPSSRE